jgi:hypothetical protein
MASIELKPQTTVTLDDDIEAGQSDPPPNTAQQRAAPPGQGSQEKNDWDPAPELPTGYPKLAGYFACVPNAALFRRFNALNMRRLLYLQADLCYLEKDLLEVERTDAICTDENERNKYATDWGAFKLSASAQGEVGQELRRQWELMMDNINPKLREYS